MIWYNLVWYGLVWFGNRLDFRDPLDPKIEADCASVVRISSVCCILKILISDQYYVLNYIGHILWEVYLLM